MKPVVKLESLYGTLASAFSERRKNPFYIEPMLKPDKKLLKLKPVVKIRKLNLRKNPYYKKQQNQELKKKPVDVRTIIGASEIGKYK